MYYGDNGIISRAEKAKEHQSNAEADDLERSQTLANVAAEKLQGETNEEITDPEPPIEEPIKRPLVTELTDFQPEIVIAEDLHGNQVVVPEDFKVRADLADTVQDGIVIEDREKNQYVWIPISNINNDGSNLIILDDGRKVEITLGRYYFDRTTGVPTLSQTAEDYKKVVNIDDFFHELTIFRESNYTDGDNGLNATAKNLSGFINSVKENKGYYFARYESSYGSGSSVSDYKLLSQVSTSTRTMANIPLTRGMLWNYITQGDASKVCRNMYTDNKSIESDLINSYTWDTAILFIQTINNNYYSLANNGTNTSIKNTGETGDVQCNIYDMASNLAEWSTEYSLIKYPDGARPCNPRGGNYTVSSYNTRLRSARYSINI